MTMTRTQMIEQFAKRIVERMDRFELEDMAAATLREDLARESTQTLIEEIQFICPDLLEENATP